MKESSSKSFLSDMDKNPKDCMAITLRSGKDLGDSKELGNSKKVEKKKVENEKVEVEKEENKSTSRKVLFPENPPQLSHLFHFHKHSKKISGISNSLHF